MGVCNSDWSVIGRTIANRVPMWVIWVLSVFTVGWIIGDAGFIGLVGWSWTGWYIGERLVDWSGIGSGLVDWWRVGLGLTLLGDLPRIGRGLVLYWQIWHGIRRGLAYNWWIGPGLAWEWHEIGIILADWPRVALYCWIGHRLSGWSEIGIRLVDW